MGVLPGAAISNRLFGLDFGFGIGFGFVWFVFWFYLVKENFTLRIGG